MDDRTSAYDYDLPPDLIAQQAIEPRDAARLMVCGASAGAPSHRHIRDLPDLLHPGDLLVLNRTKVIPARLFGRKSTGGAVEVLLIHPEEDDYAEDDVAEGDNAEKKTQPPRWRCLIGGKVRPGTVIDVSGTRAEVLTCHDDGERTLAFPPSCAVEALCERLGRIPLPPYIRRDAVATDRERYQTVFADRPGSVAAPTAALHLTRDLLNRLAAGGVETAFVDLAIGPGTFKPVDTESITDFRIHAERADCPAETVAAITACRARGGRVIAVGTTVVRTLETAAAQPDGLAPWSGWTRIFLHPPRRLAAVDGLLTNFHLPRSSLLMLVACLTGRERLLALYAEAIAERYRFFSYGDACLFLPGSLPAES